jgi:hypothetical protein
MKEYELTREEKQNFGVAGCENVPRGTFVGGGSSGDEVVVLQAGRKKIGFPLRELGELDEIV